MTCGAQRTKDIRERHAGQTLDAELLRVLHAEKILLDPGHPDIEAEQDTPRPSVSRGPSRCSIRGQ